MTPLQSTAAARLEPRGAARVAGAAAFVLALAMTASCVPRLWSRGHRPTGTCAGVCEHYTRCRGTDDPRVRAACERECAEIFASPQVCAEFERLRCEDAVAFVDGPSGRPPGAADRRPAGASAKR